MSSSYLHRSLSRPAHRRSAVSRLCPGRWLFHRAKRWTADAKADEPSQTWTHGGRTRPPCPLHGASWGTAIGGLSMNRLLVKLAIAAAVGSLLSSNRTAAQE